ncbi:MAG: hypothetical protein IIB30_04560 [Chloroflexi bacterium]|nr:hypothetical protein [Chloroflexota bacterium]
MWTIRRGHRHLGPDTLAEYMDGRLGAVARTRVDQQLAACADCREELEELQATVALLQQLPVEPVPRSFTLPVPPARPASLRPSAPLRMPQWVYAGAASAAAVVLAVLVSADATGLLGPGTPPVERGIAGETAAASPAKAPLLQESAQAPAATVALKPEVSLQSAAAAAPEAAIAAPEAPQAAPEAAMAAPAAADAARTEEMPSPIPAVESEQAVEAVPAPPATAVTSASAPPGADLPTSKPETGLTPVVEPGGTATIWRVVEGLAAALGLVFLGGLLLRRRFQRGARFD